MRSKLRSCVVAAYAGLLAIAPLSNAIDNDYDGISDVWRSHYDIDPDSDSADFDSDAYSNVMEGLFGTDPHDPQSSPALTVTNSPPSEVTLQFWGVALMRYQIEVCLDLVSWVPFGDPLLGANAFIEVNSDGPQETPCFFRHRLAADLDADLDLLADWEEGLLGSDPDLVDSDADLLLDGWEFTMGFDPVNPDENENGITDGHDDPDDDSLTTSQESLLQTDPHNPAVPTGANELLLLSVYTPLEK